MKKRAVILLMSAIALAACTKQLLQTTYDKQASYIENFISAQMKADETATLVRTEGAWRLTLNDTQETVPPRDSLNYGGSAQLWYACYTLTGSSVSKSNLVATNKEDIAKGAGWSLTDNGQFSLRTVTLNEDLLDGLRMGLFGVQPGDEAYILFTGQYAYGKVEHGAIPSRSALVYHVWIESIQNE